MTAETAAIVDWRAGWGGGEPSPVADKKPAWTLPLIDTTEWIGREPDPQAWIVPGWLARGTGAMFVGEDGIGKSLLAQQLVTAVAANRPFLGLDVNQVPTIYVTCEDSANVLHMRQRSINVALGLPVDCAPAMLASLTGYTDVALGIFDADGAFQVSPSFEAIAHLASERQAGLIVLDNVAHLFVGNENIRQQVAGFCSAIDRLAISCNAAVVVLAHPNKAGAEYSGSTGWSAHVRQRWFMDRPDGGDRDARILRKSKSNYSQAGVEIAFRWHEWAFVRDEDLPDDKRATIAAAIEAGEGNARFLACLDKATEERRAVSHARAAANYAPRVFARMPMAKGMSVASFERALERLLHLGEIMAEQRVFQRANRTWATGITRAPESAQSLAQSPHKTVAQTRTEPTHKPALNCAPYTTYRDGAAPEAAAPSSHGMMILAPGEAGDDVDLGLGT